MYQMQAHSGTWSKNHPTWGTHFNFKGGQGEQAVDCFNNISVMRLDPHPASCSSPHNTSGRWTTQRRKTGRQPLLLPPEIITRNRYSVLSDYEEHENLINSDCPCSDSDEILLIGDSIIWNVNVSPADDKTRVHTECFPCARVLDLASVTENVYKQV